MNPTEIEDHVYATYNGLRWGMTALAFASELELRAFSARLRLARPAIEC